MDRSIRCSESIDPTFIDDSLRQLTYEDYEKLNGVRSSELKQLARSAAHLKYWMDNDQKETEAMRFGQLFHTALLEPAIFLHRMVVKPKFDRRTKQGKLDHDEFHLINEGRLILDEDDARSITGMLEALKNHAFAAPLLSNGVREVCTQWYDQETGMVAKARFDFISADGEPVDIKTTVNAKPDVFERQIFSDKCRYDLQAAHYTSYGRVTGKVRADMFIIVGVEKEPPYGISIKMLDHHALAVAEAARRRLMRGLKLCLDKNEWPCYPPGATLAIPPRWLMDEEED